MSTADKKQVQAEYIKIWHLHPNVDFRLHLFPTKSQKTRNLRQLKTHTKTWSFLPEEPATWFCQYHGFRVGRVAIARGPSQNTYPYNGDDIEIGLNGVIVLKELSI